MKRKTARHHSSNILRQISGDTPVFRLMFRGTPCVFVCKEVWVDIVFSEGITVASLPPVSADSGTHGDWDGRLQQRMTLKSV